MKEIGEIYLGRMNNGAHYLFVSHILQRAEADSKVKERAAAQVSALKAAVADENANLKLSQKSLLTDDITAADNERDALYSGYKKAVQGFLNMPVTDIAQAAKVLNQHIKDYAIDPQMQLDKESGMLVNFIEDLEGKYAEQVTALSLTPFVTNLKAANERVIELTAQRTEERMTVNVGAAKASRRVSDEAYRMLVKMVNALAMVEGEAEYADFIDYVNTEIVHFKREVLGQHAKPSKPSEGGDTDQPGDGGDGGDGDDGESPDPIV